MYGLDLQNEETKKQRKRERNRERERDMLTHLRIRMFAGSLLNGRQYSWCWEGVAAAIVMIIIIIIRWCL